jgi:hypothetical protein
VNRRQDIGEAAGLIHLQGLAAHDHQTFCGQSWETDKHGRMVQYEDTTEPATCPMCLSAAQEAHELLQHARKRGLWKLKDRGSKRKGTA